MMKGFVVFIDRFKNQCYISKSKELYIKISFFREFIKYCDELDIAIIGIDFFHKKGKSVIPINPINSLDCSMLVKKSSSWREIVLNCNEEAVRVLGYEESNDNS
ncbi:hypothetical protein [Sporosalibacterium faouarense]|uniref:hypothetical protein n=1 Tax=Sporosalibacterium faouarense TaxID=516123 RepID=UPI00141CF23C|nr:hypothetical protein [Sporosalibacterium faouarense]MTI49364.1 hypothetical protein [Bacillota bacterium]